MLLKPQKARLKKLSFVFLTFPSRTASVGQTIYFILKPYIYTIYFYKDKSTCLINKIIFSLYVTFKYIIEIPLYR